MVEVDMIPWNASATLVGYGAADFRHTLMDCVRIWHGLPQDDQAVGLINVSQDVFGKSILGSEELRDLAQRAGFLVPLTFMAPDCI